MNQKTSRLIRHYALANKKRYRQCKRIYARMPRNQRGEFKKLMQVELDELAP